MNLYWVESFDHSEDWFVAASSGAEARQFFADDMGYELLEDEITSLDVCRVPDSIDTVDGVQFADEEMITACGGETKAFDDNDLKALLDDQLLQAVGPETRVVLIRNCIYVEGNVMRAVLNGMLNREG